MDVRKTPLEGLLILSPIVFSDKRGCFYESYNRESFSQLGIEIDFVQDNHSISAKKGTLRGLHFQNEPYAQTKLVRCTKGRIFDVCVDLRKSSSTFLQHYTIELTSENMLMLLIPKGFAHGFLTLCNDTEVQYKVDNLYFHEYDRTIRFDDTRINISWPMEEYILSEKDKYAPFFDESDVNFI